MRRGFALKPLKPDQFPNRPASRLQYHKPVTRAVQERLIRNLQSGRPAAQVVEKADVNQVTALGNALGAPETQYSELPNSAVPKDPSENLTMWARLTGARASHIAQP